MDRDLAQTQELLNYLDISHRLMENWAARELKTYKITVAQAQVIAIIGANEHVSQEFIANTLQIAKTAVRDSLRKLIKLDYVIRIHDADDKRIHRLSLTEEGEKFIPIFHKLLVNCNNLAMNSFTQ